MRTERSSNAVWRGCLRGTVAIGLSFSLSGIWPVDAQSQPLGSPFGPARPPVPATETVVSCEPTPPPVVSLSTGSVYHQDDRTRSTIDPAAARSYRAAIEPSRNFARRVVRLSNRYQARGRSSDAVCAMRALHDWAVADAMTRMETHQAKLGRGQFLAAVSLAYLQLRDFEHHPMTSNTAQRRDVERWLTVLAEATIAHFDARPQAVSSRQNHRYWNGLAVAATGAAVGQTHLLEWGMDSARIGLRQIRTDGVLPLELARGKRARDYHLFAVAPLVMLAEIGAANGIDLYRAFDGALHRLVKLVIEAVEDPDYLARQSGAGQLDFPGAKPLPPKNRLAWLEAYVARFPGQVAPRWLGDLRPLNSTGLGGNQTLLFRERPAINLLSDLETSS